MPLIEISSPRWVWVTRFFGNGIALQNVVAKMCLLWDMVMDL
ncbi:hypothetical protein ZOD2009_02440 [Haladaptatus paucihalophilus DX253]|uniref:Uncharacterized protein n=1 Tax=Haladaptatus paucihalophilus DX253 TaxID=797209 RepID=E7QNH0_HALPU|nr:hypothetical protein ZOD2009_02440 [Haladaptatus paucihalophilus DX253]SHK65615.1 hypothetical protein SAMN05444342_2000 [Haladaptatus paucihalophilus DX253]